MFERIVVAVDGSQNSMRAADMAIDMANRANASLFVISVISSTVYTEAPPGMVAGGAAPSNVTDKAKTDAEAFVQGVVAKAQQHGVTKVRGEVIENVPSVVDSIVDYVQEWKADVVIVGTRGLSGLRKLLLGSVSSALVSKAPCSVLVVR